MHQAGIGFLFDEFQFDRHHRRPCGRQIPARSCAASKRESAAQPVRLRACVSLSPRVQCPPKKPSSNASRRFGSTLTKASPGNGFNFTVNKLAGTGKVGLQLSCLCRLEGR